jgi:hypothetical protein
MIEELGDIVWHQILVFENGDKEKDRKRRGYG